jgi:hypothetical protein
LISNWILPFPLPSKWQQKQIQHIYDPWRPFRNWSRFMVENFHRFSIAIYLYLSFMH